MPRIPGTNIRIGPNHGHGYVPGPSHHTHGATYCPTYGAYVPSRGQLVANDMRYAGQSVTNAGRHLIHGHRPHHHHVKTGYYY